MVPGEMNEMNIGLAGSQIRNYQRVGQFKGAKGKVSVEFEAPLTEYKELVAIPSNYDVRYGSSPEGTSEHYYDENQPLPTSGTGFRLTPVHYDQPVLENGSPRFYKEKKTFDLGPLSVVSGALEGGAIGTLAGAALAGGLVGLSLLSAPIALAGAAVLGIAGTAVGAKLASGKTRELKWVKTPIVQKQAVGYQETVNKTTRTTANDHQEPLDRHTFSPIFQEQNLGTWMKPVAVIVDHTK